MTARRRPLSPSVSRRPRAARGAVLIVALLVAALIAVALGSYLTLNLSTARMSKRTFNGYAALNLGEAGTEEAVWAFNAQNHGDTTVWNGWTKSGTTAWKKFDHFDLGSGTDGWVKVYVDNIAPSATGNPTVVAQAGAGSTDDTAATKMIEVKLRRRAYFASGLVAKRSVAFSGNNAYVDSWISDPDHNPATPAIPYSFLVRTDRGSVASADVLTTSVQINNANVWGTVATGGGAPQVGNNGSIRGHDTPFNVQVDPHRISSDFNADFDPILAPVDGTPIFSLPAVLGTPGTQTKWRTGAIALSGTQTLTILGDVTIVLTASSSPGISLTGSAALNIPKGSSLTVFVAGDVKIAGNGVVNTNSQPISFQIWGTNQAVSGQDIDITGNGSLIGVVYAPKGRVTIRGDGDVMGAVVADSINFTGNAAFHYDETLADRDSNAPFTMAKWRELTTKNDRAPYLAYFNF